MEDTLELIYVRYRNPKDSKSDEDVKEQIDAIFEGQEKTTDGLDREIPFEEYLKQIRKKDLKRRKDLENNRKKVKEVINKNKEEEKK